MADGSASGVCHSQSSDFSCIEGGETSTVARSGRIERQTGITVRPSTPERASKSSSCVTTGIPCAAAVAAIQRSLAPTPRPDAARYARIAAQERAALASTVRIAAPATPSRVTMRRSRLSMSGAASTPARSSATVTIDTAERSGSASSRNGRPCSAATSTDVSTSPTAGRSAVTRSGPGHRSYLRSADGYRLQRWGLRSRSRESQGCPRASAIGACCCAAPGRQRACRVP